MENILSKSLYINKTLRINKSKLLGIATEVLKEFILEK